MNIARELTTGEIILVASIYKIGKEGVSTNAETSARAWATTIVERSEFQAISMVQYYEQKLIEKKLITERIHSDKSGIMWR